MPCTFTFRDPPSDLDGLTVTIDGRAVARDTSHVNGWDIETELLTFYGPACGSIRDGLAHTIEVTVCD